MWRRKRVMLVQPDYRDSEVFTDARLPVGLGYVAEALGRAGVECVVVDLNTDSVQELIKRVGEFCPEFLGVSMMSYRCKRTYGLLDQLKRLFPKLKIVAGGPHVTANRERAMAECPAIDIGVVGEGEQAMVEMVSGHPLCGVKGALHREGKALRYSGDRDFVDDLDRIPFPRYMGFRLERYGKYMQLASSRGCPYRCIFCGAPRILGRKWRRRSAQGMVEEVEYWYARGYRDFCFNDSNFALDKGRVRRFCDEVINRGLDVRFRCEGLRADHVDRELLKRMRRAGFAALAFGAESGSDRVLRNLRKGETRAQIESAIAAATDLAFAVTLFFLVGSPGEHAEDIKRSFQLARKYDVASAYFFNLTAIPGTEFYDWALRHGYLDASEGMYPEDNFGFSSEARCPTDVMTIGQLNRWIHEARRVERQIRWRRYLTRVFGPLTAGRVRGNNAFLTALSWHMSATASSAVCGAFLRVVKVATRVATRHRSWPAEAIKCRPGRERPGRMAGKPGSRPGSQA